MDQKNNKVKMARLRSYSSIFSSTSFSRLLQHDDYSFMNMKIEQYDQSKVGKNINTYYDYIRYTYNALKKNYKNEYVFKNTLINEIIIDHYGVKDTVAINEFRVGNSIADIVLFNGTSKAFEIKTILDSNKRLAGQLADYTNIFKECYIVTHESIVDKYLKEDSHIGVIVLVEQANSIRMEEIRHAKENSNIDVDTLMRTIRTVEYKNIVTQYYGKLPEMNSFNMFKKCKELINEIPSDVLNKLFINELKKRTSNTEIIPTFDKELRQLCLSMNINAAAYQMLNCKLNKPIKL